MEPYKPLVLLVIATLGIYTCSSVSVTVTDFTAAENRLAPNDIVFSAYTMKRDSEMTIICPKVAYGRSFGLYPFDPLHYALTIDYGDESSCHDEEPYALKLSNINEILGSLRGGLIQFEDLTDVQKLTIRYPPDEFIVRRKHLGFLYICADKEEAADESYLQVLGKNMADALIASALRPLFGEEYQAPALRTVGVVLISLDELPYATHGCSTLPSQLFLNKQRYEPVNGAFAAEFDVMKTPNIGFYCDGEFDANAFITQFDNSESFMDYSEYPIPMNDELEAKIAFINLTPKGMRHPFEQTFYCRDHETGTVRGSITLKRTRDFVCDINEQLMKHRVKPTQGNWCDVMLHPGDVLTIKFPPENGYYIPETEEYKYSQGHEDEAFVSTIIPRFFNKNGQLEMNCAGALYPWPSRAEIVKLISVDESQRHLGRIVVKFNEDTVNGDLVGHDICHCEWRLHRRGTDAYDVIAPIKVQFVVNINHK